ncbi:T9SS C-terminal target domain-containing protein [Epilithonimonas vandammei]|uniref:T9SS C-terminal target domain-containing protein n=1 Tax=Epilithonimonas vandammei TaxID=2487072 RepID=A0A3G8ZLD8_9FLAO|nr:zinc-dependent metalloprotease [Epilithonimonas vandammei]AZI40590.1 T9SS C-terminal target domain-containing protein [Epilithonimonas vandammei]AZI54721.1 T9SS C-terminal target domain-containing protein [Epilithonimonas vandammei]
MNKKLLFSVGVMFSGMLFSQKNYWKQVSGVDNKQPVYDKTATPSKYKLFKLNIEDIKADLATAPKRFSNDESLVLKFPTAEGKLVDYVVQEASVMDPALQAKYPNLRSYLGYEKGNSGNSIRFSVSPYDGVNVMYYNAGKTAYLDAYTQDKSTYMVYNREDLGPNLKGFVCGYKNPEVENIVSEPVPQSLVQDGQFRNYRLALSSTMEYSRYHIIRAGLTGGTVQQKKEAVLAAMNTTMTRVNGVYEKTISLTMTMIPNNDLLLSIDVDAYGPGFTNDSGSTLLNENQAFVDQTVGSSAYDIGHIFSTGGGGIAQLRSPCVTGSKARGVTGRSAPRTDAFDIDYVAHEMGHQWGAQHTFDNSCAGNRTATTSVEPGSGSTIMAYAGICAPNVQSKSDAYFHVVSVNQMYSNITTGSGAGCGVKTANNNQVPVIQPLTNYSIPSGTAFILTGNATDPDGDALTYLWEQTDVRGLTTSEAPISTQTSGAVFRSYSPTVSSSRPFPTMTAISAGTLAPTWEVIPTVARNLNFALFVNDNKATGNQAARANMIVTVTNVAPFKVTSQTAAANYNGGSTLPVTWDFEGTTATPINTENVQILLSSDNGLTFPTVLAESVPNNGSANVVLPNENNGNARIMVKAIGNIFFAVNATRFNINKDLAVNESAFNKGFAIYPNPAKGEINISLSKVNKGASYQIVDLSGKQISNGSLENEKTQVNISNLKTGTYRVVISNNGETTSKNLIVK